MLRGPSQKVGQNALTGPDKSGGIEEGMRVGLKADITLIGDLLFHERKNQMAATAVHGNCMVR